jgi:PAS domain S-box-containing protein
MAALPNVEGTISGLNAVFQDDSVFRLQMARFFEATTDAIFFLDRQYRFVFLNRRAHQLLASGGDDILGKVLFERYPSTVYEGSPYVSAYAASMERNETIEFEAFYPEPFNFWLRIQSHPSDDGIMVIFRDVTQDRALQQSLQRKNEQAESQLAEIEALYRTAPIGLALFDLNDYTYLRLNDRQAAFFGLKPDQIVGKTLTQMAPIEGLRELFDQVATGEPVINFPLQGSLATDEPGTLRYWTVSYFPVFGHDGTVTGITAASLEITQQRKAEQALVQSEKLAAVGRLASSIAHEINNPLEAVTNLLYLAAITDDILDVRKYLHLAEVELRRVAGITSQTLRFHKQASSPQAITGQSLFASVLTIFQGKFANASIEVLERHRAVEPVRCFEGEIRQVLSNLVSNSLDAMSSHGGRLSLRTRITTNWTTGERGVALTVADNGTGISPAVIGKLFHAFYTTKGTTGTGLGLWVSKEIIDRHKGTLRLRTTQKPGMSGTVFVVFLPFNAAER